VSARAPAAALRIAARPRWATPLALLCAGTLGFTLWRDLTLPHVRDTEVWLGFELHGALAQLTAPLHWLIFAAGAYGYARLRPWIWPAAPLYVFYVALSHLVWSEASPKGQGWPMGLLQMAAISLPGWLLLRARPPAQAAPRVGSAEPRALEVLPMFALRWLARALVALLLLAALLFVGARFHDGPLAMIPGGPLASGPLAAEPIADWSFAAELQEIELQLDSQSRSRTVWFLVHEGRGYVPCSLGFPPGKSWHKDALIDGRATLRIEGRRYPVQLQKVDESERALADALRAEVERKYANLPPGDPSQVWAFAVSSRPAPAP